VKQIRNKVSVERGAWFCRHVRCQLQVLPQDMVDTDRSGLINIDILAWTVAAVGCRNRGSATEFYIYDSDMPNEADREQHQHQQIINKQRNSNVKVNIHTVPRPRYAIIARKRAITRSRYLVSVQVYTCPRIGSTKTCCESVNTTTIRSQSTKNLPAIVARTYVVGRSQPFRQYSINCQFRSKVGQVLSTSRKKRASHSET
jgi:hypothetical protein